MSRIVFVASCFPEQILNKMIENNDIDDIAANVFGQRICNCLAHFNKSVDVVNEHKNVRFPYQMKLFVHSSEDVFGDVRYHSYGYLNVLYLERWSKAWEIKKLIKKLKPEVVVVYSMHTPYLKPVVELKNVLKYKVAVVVPDLPEFMSDRKGHLARYLKKKDIERVYKLTEKADGFIVLTAYMVERLPVAGKKYLVLEGIADDFTYNDMYNTSRENFILYSGSVSKMYGLPEFVNNYIKSNIDEELYICGTGTYVEELKEIVKYNPRIKYLGIIKRDKLKVLQRNACLLVNPRKGNDEYTKYSFPSKTMEYLSSGTPVMMERLRGIPDDYYNYIIEVDDGDWIKALKRFSNRDKTQLYERAMRALQFIKNNKTVSAQADRIKSFIEEL